MYDDKTIAKDKINKFVSNRFIVNDYIHFS